MGTGMAGRGWRAVGVVLILAQLSGCVSWRRQTEGIGPLVARTPPPTLRVTRSSGLRDVLHEPRLEGDSLVGRDDGGLRFAVATADITEVAVQQVDPGKTAGALIAAGLTVVVIVAIANASGSRNLHRDGGTGGTPVSCPLVYSWDGTNWRLDSGTFGGAISRGLQRTDVDNLDHAAAVRGEVRLRLAAELPETDYVDGVSLLAVDHDPRAMVVPDGRGRLHAVSGLRTPVAARDVAGADALARISARDGWHWESSLGDWVAPGNRVRDGLELTFLRARDAREARLVVDGRNTPWSAFLLTSMIAAHGPERAAWYDSLDQMPEFATRTRDRLARQAFLQVQVQADTGWERQDLLWEAGPEIGKSQAATLDLRGVSGDTIRVRLEAPPAFWLIDQVRLSQDPELPFQVTRLTPMSATDRLGADVRLRLTTADSSYVVMARGDQVDLVFAVPEPPAGLARSYVLESNGYYVVDVAPDPIPDRATLDRLAREPDGVSRVATERLTQAVRGLAGAVP
jgi:hypothetical protein